MGKQQRGKTVSRKRIKPGATLLHRHVVQPLQQKVVQPLQQRVIQPLQQQVIQPAATFLNNRVVQPTLAGTDRGAAKFVNNQVLTPITTLGTAVNDNFVQPVKAAGSHFLLQNICRADAAISR